MNHIIIMGRLTRDPELRTTNSGVSVAAFTVAVDREYQKGEADFIDCSAWRQTAEFVTKYFRKGNMIAVSGRLQSRKWDDRDGNKRVNWEIVADSVYFCGPKNNDASRGVDVSAAGFNELGDEEGGELPFE